MPKIYITKNLEAIGVRKDDIMGLEENRSKFEYLIGMVKYPLALALFEADMEATHISEKEA